MRNHLIRCFEQKQLNPFLIPEDHPTFPRHSVSGFIAIVIRRAMEIRRWNAVEYVASHTTSSAYPEEKEMVLQELHHSLVI